MADDFRSQLRTATFNGFEFSCMVDTEDRVGRRGVLYEFPFRDTPKFFDLGRRAREHSITAHFFGDNHANEARALKALCELPAPHVFVHPYCGTITVALRVATIRNSSEHQRQTTVDLDLVEFGFGQFPVRISNTITSLIGLASTAIDAVTSDYNANYDLASAPIFEQPDNISQLDTVLARIREAGINNAATNATTAFNWLSIQRALEASGTTYFNNTETSNLISQGIENTYENIEDEDLAYQTLLALVNDLQLSVGGGFSQIVDDNNNIAIGTARILAALYTAQAAIDKDYESFFEISVAITEVRTAILEEIQILTQRCKYKERTALLAFLDSFTDLMLERGAGLPGIIRTRYGRNLPSLVISHKLYNDSKRACEIEANNPIGHPLFMPRDIEALSN